MEKPVQYIIFFILGVTILNTALTFFSNTSIKNATNSLKKTQNSIDSASYSLTQAHLEINTIRQDLVLFSNQLTNTQKTIDTLESNYTNNNNAYTKKMEHLNNLLAQLKNTNKKIDSALNQSVVQKKKAILISEVSSTK